MGNKDIFILNKIGKKLPYGIADDFFEKSHNEICSRIVKHDKALRYWKKIVSISLNAAAILIIFVTSAIVINSHKMNKKTNSATSEIGISEVLKSLSDEEIKQLEYNSQTDPFLEGD